MKLKRSIILLISFISACSVNPMKQFQEDADLLRLEHLEYWTQVIEEYYKVKGHYPLQKKIQNKGKMILVKIATKQQMRYLSVEGDKYNKRLDYNSTGYFQDVGVKEFVATIESALTREIVEKYDIQKVPTSSPVGYYYFATIDGYLLWVTCITCGVTQVSTLLMDGFTPTVNIVSEGMKGKVTKALTRENMLNHPTYKSWVTRPFHKAEYVQNLVKEHGHDSK